MVFAQDFAEAKVNAAGNSAEIKCLRCILRWEITKDLSCFENNQLYNFQSDFGRLKRKPDNYRYLFIHPKN